MKMCKLLLFDIGFFLNVFEARKRSDLSKGNENQNQVHVMGPKM